MEDPQRSLKALFEPFQVTGHISTCKDALLAPAHSSISLRLAPHRRALRNIHHRHPAVPRPCCTPHTDGLHMLRRKDTITSEGPSTPSMACKRCGGHETFRVIGMSPLRSSCRLVKAAFRPSSASIEALRMFISKVLLLPSRVLQTRDYGWVSDTTARSWTSRGPAVQSRECCVIHEGPCGTSVSSGQTIEP